MWFRISTVSLYHMFYVLTIQKYIFLLSLYGFIVLLYHLMYNKPTVSNRKEEYICQNVKQQHLIGCMKL
nr:MAG TPA: hypothetical protein [Caudoviricetes sp.]